MRDMRRVFVTGGHGFTGRHFVAAADAAGYEVLSLSGDLIDDDGVFTQVHEFEPDYVVHLAGVSATTHSNSLDVYNVNVLGTENLLKAITRSRKPVKKILLASSASIYGNQSASPITESSLPEPVSHYGISKLAMEFVAKTYAHVLPMVICRPFNYTGPGHDERFVVPKIVRHFNDNATEIELGNINVYREFNDVRLVIEAYLRLLNDGQVGEIYNVCSGHPVSLSEVVACCESITGKQLAVNVNPAFVRDNEIEKLCGAPGKLISAVGKLPEFSLRDVLIEMLK